MSTRRIGLAVLVLWALCMPAGIAAASTGDPATADDAARIDRWVEQRMAAHQIPGAAVAVVRGGEVVHLAGYGTADPSGAAVTPDTAFLIGSASKPFTAVVVGQLVEEGVLSWDEPVWPHLSDLVDDPPDGFADATVEQLLNHTGGLGMPVGLAGAVEIHEGPDALTRRAADVLSHRLSYSPGEDWTYSNAGPTLLAAVVEQVTGRSFADELRDRVFDPLGMTGTFAAADDPRAEALATGHNLWFGRWRPADLPYDSAGIAMGYIGSTARDLAVFLQAHLDGHPAIPSTAAEIIDAPVVPTGEETPFDAGYGRGWFVDEFEGQHVVSHPGSLGHYTGHVLMVPEADGLGVAVLTNASAFITAGHEGQYDLGLGLTSLLLDTDPQPTERSTLLTLAVPTLAWGVALLLIIWVASPVLRGVRAGGLPRPHEGTRGAFRLLLPGATLLALGAGLMAAPLGVARHFYPDAGWALTAIASIALAGGITRLGLAVAALRSARRPTAGPQPDRTRTPTRHPARV